MLGSLSCIQRESDEKDLVCLLLAAVPRLIVLVVLALRVVLEGADFSLIYRRVSSVFLFNRQFSNIFN